METPLKTLWYTDRGRRPSNEDAVLVETLFGDRDLVAVADGMGGHAGGEVASRKALETLLSHLESSNDLVEAIKQANTTLIEASESNPEWRGMGTTLVALLRVGSEYHVANVGDSRAYRLDERGTHRITEDHSFTAEAISSGRLSEDEAERSPWRNALTRAVGTDETVEVDVFGPFPLEPPHMVVLCSDGLYRVMSDEELTEELRALGHRADGARDLVANALRRGSSDNISIAIVEFGDVSSIPAPKRGRGTAVRGGPSASASPVATPTAPPSGRPGAERPGAAEPGVAESTARAPDSDPAPTDAADEASEGVSGEATPERGAAGVAATPAQARAPSTPAEARPTSPSPGTRAESPRSTETARSARPAQSPGHRKARTARPSRAKRRVPRRGRRLPSWVKREGLPTLLLVGATLAMVYVITRVLG